MTDNEADFEMISLAAATRNVVAFLEGRAPDGARAEGASIGSISDGASRDPSASPSGSRSTISSNKPTAQEAQTNSPLSVSSVAVSVRQESQRLRVWSEIMPRSVNLVPKRDMAQRAKESFRKFENLVSEIRHIWLHGAAHLQQRECNHGNRYPSPEASLARLQAFLRSYGTRYILRPFAIGPVI